MGGSKTKAVGGQAVNPVAKQYQDFIGNSLNQTSAAGGAINSSLGNGGSPSIQDLMNHLATNGTGGTNPFASYQPGTVNVGATPLPSMGNVTSPIGGAGASANVGDVSGIAQMLQSLGQNNNFNFNPSSYTAPNITNSSPDTNGTYANAITTNINNSINDQAAALRENFNANGSGAGAGTPGAYAEAVLRSQAAPQIASALGELNLNENAQNLQAQGLGLQGQSLGLQNNANNNNLQLGTNQQNLQGQSNIGQFLNMAANAMNGQGQLNLSNQLGNRQADITTGQANNSSALTQQQQIMNYLLGGQSNQLQGQGLQLNQQQGLNSNNLAATQGGANYDLANNQLNSQNIGQILSFLFSGLNQTNGLGTTQAQTVQQPSGFQNFVSGVSGLTSAVAPIAGLFSGGVPGVNTGASTPQPGGFYSPQGPQMYSTPNGVSGYSPMPLINSSMIKPLSM